MQNEIAQAAEFAPDVRILVRRLFLPPGGPDDACQQESEAITGLHRDAIQSFGPGRQRHSPEDFGEMLGQYLKSITLVDDHSPMATAIRCLTARLAEVNGELNDLTKRRYLLSWETGRYVPCDFLPDGSAPRPGAFPLAQALAAKLGLWTFIKSQEPDSLPWFEEQLAKL